MSIGPEVMRAFQAWRKAKLARCSGCDRGSVLADAHECIQSGLIHADDVYPLYIGHPHNGRWYVRERMPGTRVWRAEDDGSFRLLDAFDMPPGLASAGSLRGCLVTPC